MKTLEIRGVRSGDLEASHALEACCFPLGEAASRANIAVRIERFPEGFYVAEAGGVLIGHVNSGATDKDDISDEAFKGLTGHQPDGRNIVVFSLAVDPRWRGKGLAVRLMERFMAESRHQGRARVLLLCMEHLVGFYGRLGFADHGPSSSTHGGVAWREMRLDLTAQ